MKRVGIDYIAASADERPQTRLGIVGLILALFVVTSIILAMLSRLLPPGCLAILAKRGDRLWLAVAFSVIGAWVGAVVFAIGGLLQSGRKKSSAACAIALCFVALGAWAIALSLE